MPNQPRNRARLEQVCTALGSTYEETLKEQAPKADLRLVDSYSECLELIQNGAVDAVSTDDVILTGMIIQDDTLKLTEGEPLTTEPYGAGIKKGETEVKEFVDGVLEEYKSGGGWAAAGPGRRKGASGKAAGAARLVRVTSDLPFAESWNRVMAGRRAASR